jgi:hypothetical protein
MPHLGSSTGSRWPGSNGPYEKLLPSHSAGHKGIVFFKYPAPTATGDAGRWTIWVVVGVKHQAGRDSIRVESSGSNCNTSPAMYVEPDPLYAASRVKFVMKHAGPHALYKFTVTYPHTGHRIVRPGVINLGKHRANGSGVIRFYHQPFGHRFAHFNPKTSAETWVVNAILVHPGGNEPGPFNKVFVMHKGCGCGRR